MDKITEITEKVIDKLQKSGADMAYCSASQSEVREFNVDGGEFSLFRTLFDNSLSLTAFLNGKKGSIGLNRFDDDAVNSAVSDCINAASSSSPDDAWALAPDSGEKYFRRGAVEPELDRFFDRTRELMNDISLRHPLIIMEQMIVSHVKAHTVYRNTNGALYTKDAGYYNVDLMFSAHDGEASSSFYSSGVITDNLDTPFITRGSIEKDLSDVEKQIETFTCGEKFTGVMLLPPGCLNEFLSSIADNFAGDGTILEGTSIWKDKIGKSVADSQITIRLAPSEDGIVCGQSYTSEGFMAEDFDFIRGGVLDSFLTSLYVANKTGVERAKNDGGNFVMDSGDKSIDEIIASIDQGIIVGRFSGGEPSSNGDFSGVAKNSFLIENGKITKAVSETMISGNLAAMLNNLVAISSERVADGYTLLPYAAFGGITVSGK